MRAARKDTARITRETLQACSIDPHGSRLASFIPPDGLSPREFIQAPIASYLEACTGHCAAEDKLRILTSPGILADKNLRMIGFYAARIALPIYETSYPRDDRLRRALDTGERRLKGQASLSEFRNARNLARSAAGDAALDAPRRHMGGASWTAARAALSASRSPQDLPPCEIAWQSAQRCVNAFRVAGKNNIGAWDKIYNFTCGLIEIESQ